MYKRYYIFNAKNEKVIFKVNIFYTLYELLYKKLRFIHMLNVGKVRIKCDY